MDTVIQIDLEQVFQAINHCESYGEWYVNMSKELIDLFGVIEENVTGGTIHQHITRIVDNLTMCSDKMVATTDEAIVYAKNQINAYITTFEGAQKMFERAIAMIEKFNTYGHV